MTKAKLSAVAVLLALLAVPTAAHAASSPVLSSSNVIYQEHEDGEHEDSEDGEDEDGFEGSDDEGFEDDGDKDFDDSSFVIPPVVVHPRPLDGQPGPEPRGAIDQEPGTFENHPIEVNKVHPTHKTPTDVFVDTAVIGLGAVGAGAVGLGAVVGVRAIRAKRAGTKNDYFYGE